MIVSLPSVCMRISGLNGLLPQPSQTSLKIGFIGAAGIGEFDFILIYMELHEIKDENLQVLNYKLETLKFTSILVLARGNE